MSFSLDEYLTICNPEEEYSTSETRIIKKLLDRNNITQLIYDFNIKTVLCILKKFEEEENYERCALIKRRIEIHNKITNTEYKTQL